MLLTASALAWIPDAASAQSPPASAESNAQASGENDRPVLDERAGAAPANGDIVVTATRRAESILRVPASISALDNRGLEALGAKDIRDLVRVVPGVSLAQGSGEKQNISIRGISSTAGTSTVGIYINDTPIQVRQLGAQGGAAINNYPQLFDLDRVEVLRGPQGTLFGAGSEGGTIRFITRQPDTDHLRVYGRAELSSVRSGGIGYEAGVSVSGPVSDAVAFRLGVYHRRDAGWIDRAPYPSGRVVDENANSNATVIVDASVQLQATDTLTITPSVLFERDTRHDLGSYWPTLSNPGDHRFINGAALRQPARDRFILPALRVALELGGVDLFSSTSYYDRHRSSTLDFTFTLNELLTGNFLGPISLSPTDYSSPQSQFTQEVRLQSAAADARFTWLIGAFYQQVKQRSEQMTYSADINVLTKAFFGVPARFVFGSDALPGGLVYFGRDRSTDEQIAGFAQGSYELLDGLKLTAGARIAHTGYRFENAQGGPFNGGPTAGSGSSSETPVTPKVGVEFTPRPDALLYVSASKGFRQGGSNFPVPAARCAADLAGLGLTAAPTSYDSDSVWSYEVGAKGALFNRRVRLSGSAFRIDWSNIQALIQIGRCGFAFIGNVAAARSIGFDLQADVSPVEGLSLGAAIGYADAHYTAGLLGSPIANGARAVLINDGDALPTPKWNVSLSSEYQFPVAADVNAYVIGHYNYTSAYRPVGLGTTTYDDFNRSPALYYADLRAGVRIRKLDLSVFVKNLFDADSPYSISRGRGSSRQTAFGQPPRTIGVTLSASY